MAGVAFCLTSGGVPHSPGWVKLAPLAGSPSQVSG